MPAGSPDPLPEDLPRRRRVSMYINPFFAGIVCTILAELALLIGVGAYQNMKERKYHS